MNNETTQGLSDIDKELLQVKWDNYYLNNLYTGSFRTLDPECEEIMIKLAINHSYTFSWGSLWAEFRYPPLMHSLLKFHLIKVDHETNQMGEDRARCSLTSLGIRYVHDNLPFIRSQWISPINTYTIYSLSCISCIMIVYTIFLVVSIMFNSMMPSFFNSPITFSITDIIVSTIISVILTLMTHSLCEGTNEDNQYSDEYVSIIMDNYPTPTEANFLNFLFNIKSWSRYPKQDYDYAQLAINQILYT